MNGSWAQVRAQRILVMGLQLIQKLMVGLGLYVGDLRIAGRLLMGPYGCLRVVKVLLSLHLSKNCLILVDHSLLGA